MRFVVLLFLSSVGLLVACATTKLDPGRVASVEAAIRSADADGAGAQPHAALYLKLAREELAMARQLADEGDAERAALFVERAQVDAALALAIARSDKARAEAQRARTALLEFNGGSP